MDDMPHYERLDTAFLQLSFAIKLWMYSKENPINKEKFDIELVISDPPSRINLPQNQFHTYGDLLGAIENNVSICFGVTANTLWEALREKNSLCTSKIDPDNSYEESLASLSYMLRCCFAHGPAHPKWQIARKYRVNYEIGETNIDLRNVDGQPFAYSDVAGYQILWLLRSEAESSDLL